MGKVNKSKWKQLGSLAEYNTTRRRSSYLQRQFHAHKLISIYRCPQKKQCIRLRARQLCNPEPPAENKLRDRFPWPNGYSVPQKYWHKRCYLCPAKGETFFREMAVPLSSWGRTRVSSVSNWNKDRNKVTTGCLENKDPWDPHRMTLSFNWLGLGNWVNQLSGLFVQYNDLNGTWFTQFPNTNR